MSLLDISGLKDSHTRLALYKFLVILQNLGKTRCICDYTLIRPEHAGIWEWGPSLLATCLQSDDSGVNSEDVYKMHA